MNSNKKMEYSAVKPNSANDCLWVKYVVRQLMMEGKLCLKEVINFYANLDENGRQYGKL